jgi:hypothetical protein
MWTRLLLADPTWGAPRPRLDDAIVWVLRPADGSLAQNGFGDGSVYNGSHKRLARGGWGLAVYDDDGAIQALLHGPLPGYHQDILMAELFAMWMYVRHLGAYSTDPLPLVTMWMKGQASCCHTFSKYAAIWTLIWRKVDDVGEAAFSVSWVKGHTNARHVADGVVTQLQHSANTAADGQAKLGAKLHTDVNDVAATLAARSKALEWAASYVGFAHAALWKGNVRDTTPWQDQRSLRGELTLYRGRAARVKPSAQASHVVAYVGPFTFCLKCGRYSERRWQGLARRCPRTVAPHAAQPLAQLLRGHHPRRNVFVATPTGDRGAQPKARGTGTTSVGSAAALGAVDTRVEEFGVQLPDDSTAPALPDPVAGTLTASAAEADTEHRGVKRRFRSKTSPLDAKRQCGGS